MNKLFALIAFVLCACSIQAQQEVVLNVNHLLDGAAFEFDTEASSESGQVFKVNRLEYFISKISIIHDGGEVTALPHFYIRVNAGEALAHSLGEFMVDQIEGITFYIGVEEESNHLDPASWPSGHALAPASPSMHWGWASGYRFVAFEGKCGANTAQIFELHGLGDDNFAGNTYNLTQREEAGVYHIDIDADYSLALSNIDLDSAPIVHGTSGAAKVCIENFVANVFSPSSGVSSGINDTNEISFSVAPNPSTGLLSIHIPQHVDESCKVVVSDLTGKTVAITQTSAELCSIKIDAPGVYIIQIQSSELNFAPQRIIIK